MQLAVLHPFRSGGDELKRDGVLPMLIDTRQESFRIGAAVEFGEMMRESAVLQVTLVATDEYPIIGMPEQRPTFCNIGAALLRIRHLGNVGRLMFGTAVRGPDMD